MASVSGTVLSGRYRLDRKLGSGGMSTVYLAQDEVLDRPVAVKLLHREISEEADQLERFRREARAAARLSHPNLVSVIDAGEDEGRPYIVFEYVEGDTLKKKIQQEGEMPVDEAIAYAIEIGRGLIAAHARKLVHRDVKPQNVLIDRDGRAKVTDFGIARSLESEGMTATGRVLGTTDYVSPEQAMGEDVDETSDVYSLGVVLYEMLVGDVPFKAETQVGVAMKHVNEPLPDVLVKRPEVSAAVASVVDRATTKDPRDRYASVGEMVRDLEATLEVAAARGGGTHGQATTVLDSVPRSQRRLSGGRNFSKLGVAMGVLGVALIAAALIFGGDRLPELNSEDEPSGDGERVIRLAENSATDFDPVGGDGEHPEETSLAVDGDPTGTAWSTEAYEGVFDKPGVGIYVDTGESVEATAVELRQAQAGADVEVYTVPGSSNAPEDLDSWTLAGEAGDTPARTRIQLSDGSASQFFLLWFTKLPTDEDSGDLKVEVTDIKLIGAQNS
jgi:eukaryotic-like serine/threonine-protein kinase